MFKRMSALVRRDGDRRDQFAQGWIRHGQFIADLPGIRGYVQNHVEEEFGASATPSFLRADGFVELLFDSPEAMAQAFESPAAKAMAQDEPNFLGHGSGYALSGAPRLCDAKRGNKLIMAWGEGDHTPIDALLAERASLDITRHPVTALIAKPGMAPPQAVQGFLNIVAPDAASAADLAHDLMDRAQETGLAAAVFRVTTLRFV